MKRFLLASAAVIALIAAPIAAAQYTTQSPSPTAPSYSTPQTEPGYTLPEAPPNDADPLSPNAYGTPAEPARAAAPPSAYDVPNVAAAQPGDAQSTAEADTAGAVDTAEADAAAAPQADVTLATMQEHARDAGMAALPMSPAEVCAPRSIDFEQSRLNNDARHQLINAVDRASVCEMRSVTIKAPESRADAVRQELIARGVDAGAIMVEEAAQGELEVDMAFNGVAASTPEFAAMFNSGTQMASAGPSTDSLSAPGASPYANEGYAPTSYQQPMPQERMPEYQPNGSDLGAPSSTEPVYDPNTTL